MWGLPGLPCHLHRKADAIPDLRSQVNFKTITELDGSLLLSQIFMTDLHYFFQESVPARSICATPGAEKAERTAFTKDSKSTGTFSSP